MPSPHTYSQYEYLVSGVNIISVRIKSLAHYKHLISSAQFVQYDEHGLHCLSTRYCPLRHTPDLTHSPFNNEYVTSTQSRHWSLFGPLHLPHVEWHFWHNVLLP